MSDNQFGPPQPGFGPPQQGAGAPIPPQQGAPAPQPGYGYPGPAQQPAQSWGGAPVPQQGYPAGAPGFPPGYPAPPKKSRKGLWITLSIVSAVILGGGGVVAYLAYDTVAKTGKYKVALPAKFQDMSSEAGADAAQQMADQMKQDAAADPDSLQPEKTVAALYRSEDESRILIAAGGYGKVSRPSKQVDEQFKSMEKEGDTVSQRKTVDAGPLGGSMDCALVKSADSSTPDLSVCVWADYSSVMMVMEQAEQAGVDKIAADTRELRQISEVLK
ncbi:MULTISPECIES: hypothetical protein [Kitasatospora]|uniref:Uncharacterized protein n=1 Tax=Kitasatospora setae (strain ATCC 33774 / DSM 43861 / JCM 3304 / KCC A-0304 / NBRC 14216 / KM-6054) TaxID=452652 RepID=E4NB56_KITSK|nr:MULTISPECIES: hypothetical protein [Kitasatospora]BAJ28437.1 hypothetical protein KSE_26250 [Kitasatospora setae KM-6054]